MLDFLLWKLKCIFVLFTLINGVKTCGSSDQSCYSGNDQWCCSYNQKCGDFSDECFDDITFFSPTVIGISAVVLFCCLVSCLTCCIHKCHQRQRHTNIRSNQNTDRRRLISQQQQNASIQPILTSRSYPFVYEEPPPPYEEIVSNQPSAPPFSAEVEQFHQQRF